MSAPPPDPGERTHVNGVHTWAFDVDGDEVLAVVTTRHGGRSIGPYEGLNLAFHVGDDPTAVTANRTLVCEALGVDRLTVADQQHGRRVAVVDAALAGAGHDSLADAQTRLGSIDAMVTDVPGVALAILVADCAPVVLHDPAHRALGVAHVGRTGAVLDVVGATVDAMTEHFGTRPADLVVGIGPCVAAAGYEIDGPAVDEVRAAFGDRLLEPTRPGHATFDLLAAVLERLAAAGVPADQIQATAVDTRTHDALFSSRAHRPHGCFALVAALRPDRGRAR
ncbi:MAG: polyphenol oxidase family protein [Acidimicrobiales bacterium]